jgi:hypothetical protein
MGRSYLNRRVRARFPPPRKIVKLLLISMSLLRVSGSHHCGTCHGLDGEATGVPFADKMAPPVPCFPRKMCKITRMVS